MQKANQQEFRIEKVFKRKGDKLYVKWKVYATKTDIKNISHVDTSNFALKPNLACLKTEVDKLDIYKLKSLPNILSILKNKVAKLDIDKLKPVQIDLSKLSNMYS